MARKPKIKALSIDDLQKQRVQSLTADYAKNVLCGWVGNDLAQMHYEMFGANLPTFQITDPQTDYKGKRQMLWEFTRKVLGRDTENYPQEVGDCVSFGGKNVTEYLQCVEIAMNGEAEKFRATYPPYFYGTSRVQVGGGGMWGDGSSGAWLQEAIKQYGILAADEPGVPLYSGGIARQWGSHNGPPANFLDIGRQHLVKTTAQITDAPAAALALLNGYPIAICSNRGFNMTPSSDGFHSPRSTWNHCVLPDEVIGAYRPLLASEVRVGDMVIGHDGLEHRVNAVHVRHYQGNLAHISAVGMTPLRVTTDHPVLVYRRMPGKVHLIPGRDLTSYGGGSLAYLKPQVIEWEHAQPCWVAARDVQVGDYLLTPIEPIPTGDPVIPQWVCGAPNVRHVPLPLVPSTDLAWLFGLYIADGHSVKGHRVVITLNKHERETLNRACRVIRDLLGLPFRVVEKPTYSRIVVNSAILANSFREWFGNTSATKKIPEFLFRGWNRASLVEGILDGDGCDRSNGSLVIATTSRHLSHQLRRILISEGETPKINKQKRGLGCYANAQPMWTINWKPGCSKSRFARWGNYYLQPVTGNLIVPYTGDVHNYEVDEVETYTANGVVVHNCMTLIGFDDSDPAKGLYFIILNSWGDVHGQLKDFASGQDLPVGVLRVRGDVVDGMLSQGDSYAFSALDGFPDNTEKLEKALFNLFFAGRR